MSLKKKKKKFKILIMILKNYITQEEERRKAIEEEKRIERHRENLDLLMVNKLNIYFRFIIYIYISLNL